MSETQTLTAARVPTVYFIDDSATMREVIQDSLPQGEHPRRYLRRRRVGPGTVPETAPDAVITGRDHAG